jgi:hypothetical protein
MYGFAPRVSPSRIETMIPETGVAAAFYGCLFQERLSMNTELLCTLHCGSTHAYCVP